MGIQRYVNVGSTDLKTLFPEVAAEVDGWDPTAYSAQSNKKMPWVCSKGHRWEATLQNRTLRGSGCPYCAGKKAIKGETDLQTLFPELAKEAVGWDPSEVLPGAKAKFRWKCSLDHNYDSSAESRTKGRGCPYCASKKALLGFNTFLDHFPEIAKEADGWDPGTVTYGSSKKQKWKCSLGHTWEAPPKSRKRAGCPVCAGVTVLQGFNDLLSQFPEVAKEADGWDPATTHAASHLKQKWICSKGHRWQATVKDRTGDSNCCPFCADHGFNRDKDAWFYLMERPGEQQIGITNDLETRINYHRGRGWNLMETVGPIYGDKVLQTERTIKRWLKQQIGTVKGTTENWATSAMEVRSLADLKNRSGIETDLF